MVFFVCVSVFAAGSSKINLCQRDQVQPSCTRDQPVHLRLTILELCATTQQTNARAKNQSLERTYTRSHTTSTRA